MGQQDCAHILHAESKLAQGGDHICAVTGETGVDEHDTVPVPITTAAGDQSPVDQVGVDKVNPVCDGREDWCHLASVERSHG